MMYYRGHVEQIGIRELRQHASRWLAKVKAGAIIQIADRGIPVARPIPISADERNRGALIADGLLIPAPNRRAPLQIGDLLAGPPLTPILDQQRTDR